MSPPEHRSSSPTRRLPAAERQLQIIEAATRRFADRGFGGTTTASVALEASVNEALLFRHFTSKQGLFVACVDHAWAALRDRVAHLCVDEPEARHWRMPGRAFLELVRTQPHVAQLWVRALVETTGIPTIDERLATLMDEVHEFVADLVRRSQAADGTLADRDPATEAWTIVAIGLLGASLGTRGLVEPGAYDAVLAAHRTWLTGDPD